MMVKVLRALREDTMAFVQNSKSAAVRARLNHPVIDSDVHSLDYRPALIDHLKAVGGPSKANQTSHIATAPRRGSGCSTP